MTLLIGYLVSCAGFTVAYSLFGYMGWSREDGVDPARIGPRN